MKKSAPKANSRKKSPKPQPAHVESKMPPVTAIESGPNEGPGILETLQDGSYTVRPYPGKLLLEAEAEPHRGDLAEYHAVIVRLREKRFSFREIAEWLSEKGVDANHNAVYRVYTKYMSNDQIELESNIEEEQRDEAMERAEREGR